MRQAPLPYRHFPAEEFAYSYTVLLILADFCRNTSVSEFSSDLAVTRELN
jgi:hypothetical protein